MTDEQINIVILTVKTVQYLAQLTACTYISQ